MRSIRAKLTIILLAVILIAIGVTGGVSVAISGNVIARESLDRVVYSTESNAYKIDSWLNSHKTAATTLANILALRQDDVDYLSAYILNNPHFMDDILLKPILNTVLREHDEIFEVYIGFPNGRGQTASGHIFDYLGERGPLHWTSYLRPWYILAMSDPSRAHVTPPYVDSQTGLWCITVTHAVKNGELGAIGLDIFVTEVEDIVFGIMLGEGDSAMLLDGNGYIYVHQNEEHYPTETGQFHNITNISGGVYAEVWDAIKRGEMTVRARDENGVWQHHTASRLDSTGWYLVTSIPASVINRPINTVVLLIIPLTLAIMGAATLLLHLTLEKVVTKPLTILTRGVRKVSNGDLEHKIEVRSGNELEALANSFNVMTTNLRKHIDTLFAMHAENERISTELNIATQIQADMIPNIFPAFPNREEFEIFATMQPAKEVGGDFYDFFLIDDDHLCVVIADVSGKGVPAALFMVIAKTLINVHARGRADVQGVLTKVNNLLREGNETAMFVTAWIGVLEISTGKMIYVNAGHNPPLLMRAGEAYEYLKTKKGFMLAGMENFQYKQLELQLGKGDCLYLYTDGVTEATNAAEELYGAERLRSALYESRDLAPPELLSKIKESIDQFADGAPQADDITMLALLIKS